MEIAATLQNLTTDTWRLVFVRRLVQEKVAAFGSWPENFLLVGNDPAIIDLARLEERWLKLDR